MDACRGSSLWLRESPHHVEQMGMKTGLKSLEKTHPFTKYFFLAKGSGHDLSNAEVGSPSSAGSVSKAALPSTGYRGRPAIPH